LAPAADACWVIFWKKWVSGCSVGKNGIQVGKFECQVGIFEGQVGIESFLKGKVLDWTQPLMLARCFYAKIG